jgi:type II secretory pathway pseudopilin PulG
MKTNNKSFTLTELLIVLALLSILFLILILILFPSKILSNARNIQRTSDLRNIEKTIKLLHTLDPNFSLSDYLSANTLYISLPDSSSTCGSYLSNLPSLPSGWQYHCSSNPLKTDGTGWIPIPFSNFKFLNLPKLFIDPLNKPPFYYTFAINNNGFELTALKENNNEEIIVSSLNERITPISRGGSTGGSLTTFLKTIGGSFDDMAHSIQQTSDGGYIVAGESASDFLIVKLNSSGNIQWAKTIGGTDYDYAYSIQQTSDGGYMVAGWSYISSIYADFLIIKLDSLGNIQWEWAKTIDGSGYDEAFSIQQTSDGGYIVAGSSASFSSSWDSLIIKLNSSGNIQWAKTIGGTNDDIAYSIQQTSDGGYIVAGYSGLLIMRIS